MCFPEHTVLVAMNFWNDWIAGNNINEFLIIIFRVACELWQNIKDISYLEKRGICFLLIACNSLQANIRLWRPAPSMEQTTQVTRDNFLVLIYQELFYVHYKSIIDLTVSGTKHVILSNGYIIPCAFSGLHICATMFLWTCYLTISIRTCFCVVSPMFKIANFIPTYCLQKAVKWVIGWNVWYFCD